MSDERDTTIDDLDVTDAEAAQVEGGAFKSVGGLKAEADAYQKEPTGIEIPN